MQSIKIVMNAEQAKESLTAAMRLLVEDSNNKLNATLNYSNDKTSKQSRTHHSVESVGQPGKYKIRISK